MEVIPAINETDFGEVKKKMEEAHSFGSAWVHLDVSDGKFTKNTLWNNPKDLAGVYATREQHPHIEVHLMVENPDDVLDDWLDAGVKRVIVHVESAKDTGVMKMKCGMFGVQLVLAAKPDTSAEQLLKYKNDTDGFLILSVNPGLAGQKFQEDQLGKIRVLRSKIPDAKIEVDGGVNLENALAIKNAGADILVSASYIWNSEKPKKSYELLNKI